MAETHRAVRQVVVTDASCAGEDVALRRRTLTYSEPVTWMPDGVTSKAKWKIGKSSPG
jgi:hypothetical protein